MNDFKQRLTSRKFLLTLGAILSSFGAAFAGEITWFQAIIAITISTMGYVGVEGYADAERVKWIDPISEEEPVG